MTNFNFLLKGSNFSMFNQLLSKIREEKRASLKCDNICDIPRFQSRLSLFQIVTFFVSLISLLVQSALTINETRLHKELLKGYNKHTHPKLPGTGPVMVTFDFQLIGILDVVSLCTT